MKFDDYREMPEGNFIPGIYNYCNRWCERCIYTDRCMSFATEIVLRKEIEEDKRREKSIEENKEFWAQVNKTVEDAAELIDEEIPLLKKDHYELFDDWENDEDVTEAMKEYEEKREKAKKHPLSEGASKYEKAVHAWFDERKDVLKLDYNPQTEDLEVSYPGIVDKADLKQLSESVEVIRWYHIQLWIKIRRALSSQYEEDDDGDMLDGFPKDSDGSAMVALMGINSSIGAWSHLLGWLNTEKENIQQMIRMLLWLKMEIEKIFPNSRDFEWPPKSD